jgi:hypothetical protein
VDRTTDRLGLLQELPGPRAGDLWIDAYRLAPVEKPLNKKHSKTFGQITDHMLTHGGSAWMTEFRKSGVVTKLLGGIRHRSPERRMLYAEQFL